MEEMRKEKPNLGWRVSACFVADFSKKQSLGSEGEIEWRSKCSWSSTVLDRIQSTHNQISSDRRSQWAWSDCVPYIPSILGESPDKFWFYRSLICVLVLLRKILFYCAQGFALSSSSEGSQQSIFTDFSPRDLQEPCNTATFSHSCLTFSSWLCQDGNCLFALATGTGMILLIKLPPPGTDGELK